VGTIIKNISIIIISLFLSFDAVSQCQVSSDFNDYDINGMSTTIQWNLFSSTSVICNSSDWQPSFFVNQDSLLNVKITGDIYISSTTNDDDFVGFVFGYKAPNSGTISNNNHFYLFDWRKNVQHAPEQYGGFLSKEGFNLSYVNGIIGNDPITTYKYFWGHEENESFLPIDNLYGNNLGWDYNTTYHFELIYTSNKIIISINNQEIFNIDGCYYPGLFGLYSFNQTAVIYRNVKFEQYYSITLNNENETACEEVAVGFDLMDTNCANVPESLTSYLWNFGDGSNFSDDLSPQHIYNDAGENNVELYITDLNFCTDTIRKTIYVEPKAVITAQPEDVECLVGDAIHFSVEVENAEYYQWYFQEDGISYWSKLHNNGYFTGATSPNLQLYNVRPSHDNMKFRCVAKGSCENPVTTSFGQIFISDIPVRAQLGSTTSHVCSHDSSIILLNLKELYLIQSARMCIQYDTNHFVITNHTFYFPDINFNFYVEDGFINIEFSPHHPINLNEAILASINFKTTTDSSAVFEFNWNNENTYFISEVGDTILNILENMTLQVNSPYQSGLNDTISMCSGSQLELNDPNFTTINWSNGDEGPVLNTNSSGDYWVDLLDVNSCARIDTFYLNVIEQPVSPMNISLDKLYYCEYDQEINVFVEGGRGDCLKLAYVDQILIDSIFENTNYTVKNPGHDFSITASWHNSCGDSQSLQIPVPVYPLVEPSLTIDDNNSSFQFGEYAEFTVQAKGIDNNPYFIWRLDNVIKQTGADKIFVTNELKQNQNLKVSLYSDARCTLNGNYAEAEMKINLQNETDYFVPQLVLVNGSARNNEFRVMFSNEDIYHFMLQVFDMSGREVFSSKNRHEAWQALNVKNGSFGMYTFKLRYSHVYNPSEEQIIYASGKFLLKK